MTSVRTTITALGQRGEGIAEVEGKRVFVPFTLPGEEVDIAVEGERGTLLDILAPSPQRAEPFSPYFGRCGGCALQHLSGDPYAEFKRGLVASALRAAGLEVPVAPLVEARGVGRRRATLHARKEGAGYMRARTHDVLDIDHCAILVPELERAAPEIVRSLFVLVGDCDVSFTATATGLDVAVKTARRGRPDRLAAFAQQAKLARLSVNGELVLETHPPQVRMGKAVVELPIGGFLQATEAGETALSNLVLAGVGRAKSAVDLFCGVGPFALRLAETMKIDAFDSDRAAIAALDKAARHTRGLKPVAAKARDLFRNPLAPVELEGYDAGVLDPPRAGAEQQVGELVRSRVKTLVYVSCDPQTFARDAAILVAGAYELETVTPVDQFAFSTHVEMVGVFRR